MTPIDEIKARIDIVQYIGRTVALKRAGRTYKACCPFHDEKTPSFVVDPDRQTWRCYGACATGGDLFNFVMKRNGWTFAEALRELANEAGVELQQQTPEQKQHAEQLERLRGLMQAAADFYRQQFLAPDDAAARVRAYVQEKRGLRETTAEQFQIGCAPDRWTALTDAMTALGYTVEDLLAAGLSRRSETGRVYDYFRNRLLIPIRDERGRVVGFGGRALDPNEPAKYINSPQTPLFDKSRLLFALDRAAPAIRQTETAVIVEGYMDAIQAHQAGYTNVVAQMGTALTEPQLRLIAPKWAKRIVLALDSDAAGQSATLRSLEVARSALQADYAGRLSVEFRILTIPDAKDPDDLIREQPEAWAGLVESAVLAADYVIAAEVGALPANASVQQREAAARRLLPLLLASENDLYKKDNLQKLALKLRIPERDLLAWADEQIRIQRARAPQRPPTPAAPPPPSFDDEPLEIDIGIDLDQPVQPADERAQRPDAHPHEEYMLRMLYQEPRLYYEIGRKFYELAAGDADLIADALADLNSDDFQGDHHRIFITVFRGALEQVEVDPSDYIRDQLGELLTQRLEAILIDERDYARDRVSRERLLADFHDTWSHHVTRGSYTTVDRRELALEQALRLRLRRLVRELEQHQFMLLESADDLLAQQQHTERVRRLLYARRLVETELARLTRPVR
ncbi:MAG: DNA primase [Candidatus Flexifilum sp.]